MLVIFRLLCAHIFFSDQLLPPFLSPLLQIPSLKVIDDTNMVELFFIDGGSDSLILPPKILVLRRDLPFDPHHQQRVIKKVQTFKENGVFHDDFPQF